MDYKAYYKEQKILALKNAKTMKQIELINDFYGNLLLQIERVKNGSAIR